MTKTKCPKAVERELAQLLSPTNINPEPTKDRVDTQADLLAKID